MSNKHLEEKIAALIGPAIASMGYDLVRVKMGEGSGNVLQIMAERSGARTMTLDDCTRVSETVSALLDVNDPVRGGYRLEVSSPGIDRPLVKREDFRDFAGNEVKLSTLLPVNGRKRYKGTLLGLTEDGEGIKLQLPEVPDMCTIPLENIESARLTLTDALLAAHRQ